MVETGSERAADAGTAEAPADAGTAEAPAGAAAKPRIPFPRRRVARAVAERELAILEASYPDPKTALDYTTPFELLIAVILSAQCTDARVNLTTPALFARYPDAAALAAADPADVEPLVKSCGFFRVKAKNVVACARAIVAQHGGAVPREREALEALAGVGRKTASVVMSVAFAGAAFAVDTHVFRVARRLGLSLGTTPRRIEDDVVALLPAAKLRHAHHWLILHGRTVCKAPTPLCDACPVRELCPSAPIVARFLARKAKAKRAATPRSAAVPRRGAPAAAAPRPSRAPRARAPG